MGIIQSQKNLNFSPQFGYHQITTKGVSKQYELTSKQQQQSFRNLVSMYKSFDVPTILPIVASEPINNQNAILYGWRLAFKYLPHTLEDEVNEMIKKGQRYSEEQILKIIDCILSASMGFKLKNLPLGNVNCQNIFVDYNPQKEQANLEVRDHQDESKKIYSMGLRLLLNSNEQQEILSEKQYNKRYLSPLNLMQIQEGRNKLLISQKNDVFALGLLIIRLMLLWNIRQLYDYQNLKIKQDLLSRKLFQCRQYYSDQLCNIVASMTERLENSRPDFQQIFNYCFSLMSENEVENQNQSRRDSTPSKPVSNNEDEKPFQPISFNNSKQKNRVQLDLFEKKPKLQPNPIYVSSPELTKIFHKSKQSEIAWNKFRNRIVNKNISTPKNQLSY